MFRRIKLKPWLPLILIGILFCYILHLQAQTTRPVVYVLAGVEGWDFNTSRDVSLYILPDNFTTLIMPKGACDTSYFLIVIICSAPANFEIRKMIRETWGSETNVDGYSNKFYFLLGRPANSTLQQQILEESEAYLDIFQEDFIDTYNNLTLKSIMMLKLVTSKCSNNVQYVMKIDDDMFVHMKPLVKMLSSRNSSSRVLVGDLICGAKPIKECDNKWYAPDYMYSKKVYPNYLSGTGYVMSIDTASLLYEAALKTSFFHLEDIYITGICAKVARIKPTNHEGFTLQKHEFNPCIFRDLITTHHFTPSELKATYALTKEINLEQACRHLIITRRFTVKPKKKKRQSTCK